MRDAFDVAVAGRPVSGELRSGDAAVVADRGDHMMLAAIDGLGHGAAAAEASERARDVLETHAGAPLTALLERCHRAPAGTRGAAITLAALHATGAVDWLAVGNVEAAVHRPTGERHRRRIETIFHNAGVVGAQLPSVAVRTTVVGPGDALVLTTDGIASTYLDRLTLGRPAQQTADWILAHHARPADDALVVVALHRVDAAVPGGDVTG